MYQIKNLQELNETCHFCETKFKKAEMRDGRDGSYGPIMPSGGTYGHTTLTSYPSSSTSSQSSSSSSNSQSEDNTFEKFMNGDLDLATSFWGFLIVGTMIIGFVCGFLSEAYGKGWVIPLAIYTYLAVAGTWQAAEKYKIQQSKKKQTEVWGVLTQAVCVLNVISVISVLYETFVK